MSQLLTLRRLTPRNLSDFDRAYRFRQALGRRQIRRSKLNNLDTKPKPQSDISKDKSSQKSASLSRLIKTLQDKIETGDPIISQVEHPEMLIETLKELNRMIGMKRLKESAASQVMRLIRALHSGQTNLGMLNTILYGKPGVGKTRVGLILAKIWYSLGFLQKNAKVSWEDMLSTENPESLLTMIVIGTYILIVIFDVLKISYDQIGFKWTLIVVILAMVSAGIVFWILHDILEKKEEKSGPGPSNSVSHHSMIKVVSRKDFVGKFLGQTAPKTNKLLRDNMGKVLFIDEAYSLYNGMNDQYGMEALTTLNLFLSENPNKIVVILAGYKDLMQNGVFSVQPGLPRRCMWHFECDDYNGKELGEIFSLQLAEKGLKLENSAQVMELVKENPEVFSSFGGDTERLVFFSQLEADKRAFLDQGDLAVEQERDSVSTITLDDVKGGIISLRKNNIQTGKSNDCDSKVNPESLKILSDLLSNQSGCSSGPQVDCGSASTSNNETLTGKTPLPMA